MSVFRRMRDITVATFNEHLEQSQDPVQLIDQFLYNTRQEIAEAEKLHQQYAVHTRQMKQQLDHALSMQAKREEQALLALKADEEHVAKLALQEKMLYAEKEEQYRELWEQSRESLRELEQQLDTLKTEYQTVHSKRQYYAARVQTLRLQQQMNERAGTYGGRNVPRMFNRLEDRVADMEAETQSLRDLRRGEEHARDAHSGGSLLEQEWARLKSKLNNSGKE
ncbi:PspA/IM30 family protein [Paenibacillus kribbensis]|uniref:Phage shock protein A n=1 Tax=Paenibacillus kribbensis TaxID=172713 RepID=A0A222WJL9_9BACL|nr:MULTISPECIES: PspA/IM30 family protein [Paenibacillus]ASR45993.1 phage shock protein A [Paenibacillus kribbensis]EHS55939.1 phage shock protein a, pspa [Paenibacillus sp. Aloe-11]MEC0237533.1 PspA/IM30 family protein [Paenibacillus kribbensis]